jgi:hypothetical protein
VVVAGGVAGGVAAGVGLAATSVSCAGVGCSTSGSHAASAVTDVNKTPILQNVFIFMVVSQCRFVNFDFRSMD